MHKKKYFSIKNLSRINTTETFPEVSYSYNKTICNSDMDVFAECLIALKHLRNVNFG